MSLSQYHGCCLPWVFANSKSPCLLYHESMSKPWVHVCTIIPIQNHGTISIPKVFVKSMLPFLYHGKKTVFRYTEIQITRILTYKLKKKHKYSLQIYRYTNWSITKIQNTKLKKYNLQKCKNTKYRITEIQVTFEFQFFGTLSVHPFDRHLHYPFLWHLDCSSIS